MSVSRRSALVEGRLGAASTDGVSVALPERSSGARDRRARLFIQLHVDRSLDVDVLGLVLVGGGVALQWALGARGGPSRSEQSLGARRV